MKRPPLRVAAGAEAHQQNIQSKHSAFTPSPQLPETISLPVDAFDPRPLRPCERSLMVCRWWAMRRRGAALLPGVIVIEGGRP